MIELLCILYTILIKVYTASKTKKPQKRSASKAFDTNYIVFSKTNRYFHPWSMASVVS